MMLSGLVVTVVDGMTPQRLQCGWGSQAPKLPSESMCMIDETAFAALLEDIPELLYKLELP